MLRTGREYLDQIRSRRIKLTVGTRQSTAIEEPALVRQAIEVARYYDLQATSPQASVELPRGERRGWVHHLPRTQEQLAQKAEALLALARGYEGFLGRAPDYMGVLIPAYASARNYFGEYGDNIADFAAAVARGDLFVTHSTTTLRSESGANTDLEIVEYTADGLALARHAGRLGPGRDERSPLRLPRAVRRAVPDRHVVRGVGLPDRVRRRLHPAQADLRLRSGGPDRDVADEVGRRGAPLPADERSWAATPRRSSARSTTARPRSGGWSRMDRRGGPVERDVSASARGGALRLRLRGPVRDHDQPFSPREALGGAAILAGCAMLVRGKEAVVSEPLAPHASEEESEAVPPSGGRRSKEGCHGHS